MLHNSFFKIKEYKRSRYGHSEEFKTEINRSRIFLHYVAPSVMMVAFAAGALLTASAWLGALTALSLFVLLGFVGEVIPFGYAVGFRDDNALGRATAAGFLLVTLYTILRLIDVAPSHLMIFETGSLVIGSIIGYLGLLIASIRWYPAKHRRHWCWMQAISIVACFAGVFFGSLIGAASLQIIAGVFLGLLVIEKMVEIPVEDKLVPWLVKGIILCILVYVIVHYGAPFYAAHFIH